MKTALRIAVAVAGLGTAATAHADAGGISAAGWWSMVGVLGVVGIFYLVYKKVGQ